MCCCSEPMFHCGMLWHLLVFLSLSSYELAWLVCVVCMWSSTRCQQLRCETRLQWLSSSTLFSLSLSLSLSLSHTLPSPIAVSINWPIHMRLAWTASNPNWPESVPSIYFNSLHGCITSVVDLPSPHQQARVSFFHQFLLNAALI